MDCRCCVLLAVCTWCAVVTSDHECAFVQTLQSVSDRYLAGQLREREGCMNVMIHLRRRLSRSLLRRGTPSRPRVRPRRIHPGHRMSPFPPETEFRRHLSVLQNITVPRRWYKESIIFWKHKGWNRFCFLFVL